MKSGQWQAWVWIKWKPGTSATAWETWKANSQITAAWSTLGEWDCVLCVNVSDPDQLENFVWKTIRTNEWVQNTQTSWAKKWW